MRKRLPGSAPRATDCFAAVSPGRARRAATAGVTAVAARAAMLTVAIIATATTIAAAHAAFARNALPCTVMAAAAATDRNRSAELRTTAVSPWDVVAAPAAPTLAHSDQDRQAVIGQRRGDNGARTATSAANAPLDAAAATAAAAHVKYAQEFRAFWRRPGAIRPDRKGFAFRRKIGAEYRAARFRGGLWLLQRCRADRSGRQANPDKNELYRHEAHTAGI